MTNVQIEPRHKLVIGGDSHITSVTNTPEPLLEQIAYGSTDQQSGRRLEAAVLSLNADRQAERTDQPNYYNVTDITRVDWASKQLDRARDILSKPARRLATLACATVVGLGTAGLVYGANESIKSPGEQSVHADKASGTDIKEVSPQAALAAL